MEFNYDELSAILTSKVFNDFAIIKNSLYQDIEEIKKFEILYSGHKEKILNLQKLDKHFYKGCVSIEKADQNHSERLQARVIRNVILESQKEN